MRSVHRSSNDYDEELGLLLRRQKMQQQQQQHSDLDSELSLYRSGSAPPTVEGSLSAVGSLFSGDGASIAEEELRSNPNYVSYYYSNVNRNPRLPSPLLSREDWRFAQRSSVLGGIGARRKVNEGLSVNNGGNGSDARKEWSGNGLIGLPGLGLGSRQKSIAEVIQDDVNHGTSVPKHPSYPATRNAFGDNFESSASQYAHMHHDLASIDIHSGANIQNIGGVASQSYASALAATLSRKTTPDPQLLARTPSPCIPSVGGGKANSLDKRSVNGPNSFNNEPADLVGALSDMTLLTNHVMDENSHLQSRVQHELDDDQKLLHLQRNHNNIMQNSYSSLSDLGKFQFNSIAQSGKGSYLTMSRGSEVGMDLNNPSLVRDGKAEHHMPFVTTASAHLKGASIPTLNVRGSSPSQYKNVDNLNSSFLDYGLSGYVVNPASLSFVEKQLTNGNLPRFENSATAMGVSRLESRAMGGDLSLGPNLIPTEAEFLNLRRVGNHNTRSALEVPHMDPLYLQYLMSTGYGAAQVATLVDPAMDTGSLGSSYKDLLGLQKAYPQTLLSSQKSQYGLPYFEKSGSLNHGYYGNTSFGLGGSYSESTLGGHHFGNSPVGLGGSMRHVEQNILFPSGMRNLSGAVMGWQSEAGGSLNGNFGSSLLDEFKSNKAKCFELSEISGHVVEFSADQYGSRFIQQKLEIATAEEKHMVFHEIMPQALSLMTDVFGNYVIQKLFEHGSASQIRELADQLTGHVLTLSLQMYGCRVIQKAIEVVDLDQKTKMVAELDGHVMRCVRDQNGNHVIQKCIESIPENAIQFIVSTFYDQVVTLSTHPYGCRVIQRVLEHCSDPRTQHMVMDEILQSVYILAQDQYGNYVVQHVLEHGKPHERSAIMNKLFGQIVQMSLQKFASNVVEKCLTFGTPEERQMLVNEMLGSTDENEPLQVMMKDQYANYVVQKVLETCDDQQLELILNRIKVHLNALKKYTYGKHIFTRVEKLVAAGERRIGSLSSYTV